MTDVNFFIRDFYRFLEKYNAEIYVEDETGDLVCVRPDTETGDNFEMRFTSQFIDHFLLDIFISRGEKRCEKRIPRARTMQGKAIKGK